MVVTGNQVVGHETSLRRRVESTASGNEILAQRHGWAFMCIYTERCVYLLRGINGCRMLDCVKGLTARTEITGGSPISSRLFNILQEVFTAPHAL